MERRSRPRLIPRAAEIKGLRIISRNAWFEFRQSLEKAWGEVRMGWKRASEEVRVGFDRTLAKLLN